MKTNILTLSGLLITSLLFGQENLPNDTFRVVKEYQPVLIDAEKISSDPEIDDDLKIELDLDYSFVNKQIPVTFQLEPITPAKIKGEPLVKLYNGYARVGVGNALVPFGEIYYNTLRSKEYSIGAHASYLNMREVNKIEDIDNSNLNVEIFGKRFWKRNTLNSTISFDRNAFNYYGYHNLIPNTTAELPKPKLEQYYNRISARVGLQTTKQDSFNLRHSGEIEYKLTSNASNNQEHNIVLNGNLNQFKNSELYNLDVLIDYNEYDFNSGSTIIGLKPQISTIGERFRINAGLGIFVDASKKTSFHFYPIAEIKYNVIDDILVPYLGVKGEVRRVNYASITTENLFVAENISLKNTNEKYNLYAGLRGTLSKKFSFNVSGALLKTEDDYLYVQLPGIGTNRSLTKEYYLIYDEIQELQFKGEFAYKVNDKIMLYGLAEYINYDTKNEQLAWHRPELKASLSAAYNLRSKIIIKSDIIFIGEQDARGEQEVLQTFAPTTEVKYNVEKLKSIIDANLSVEYRYTKRLSAFVKFNNIGGINFEKYKDYPTQGFNVWGGFTYAF